MKPLEQETAQADASSVRQRRLDAVVVSRDDGFLIELGPLLGDRYRTRIVESADAVDSAIGSSRWLALVDTTSIPDSRDLVARLEQQHGDAPIIVIADDTAAWNAAVGRGSVLACVPRELINGAALTEALALAERQLEQASPERPPAVGSDAARALAGPPGRKRSLLIAGAAAALAAVLVLGWWLLHRSAAPSAPVAASVPAPQSDGSSEPAPTPQPQDVLELLSAARVAIRDQKLLPRTDGEPRGDSALELYAQALLQEPSNDEALDGSRRLFTVARARIQSDVAGGKLEDANRILLLFKNAGIEPEAWREVETSIVAARPKWLASKAQESIAAGDYATAEQILGQLTSVGADRSVISELRRAIEGKKVDQQLQALANEVKSAIEAGSLLEPTNDNARTRLQTLRNLNRTHPITIATQKELQAALLGRAQEATRKDQFDQAQRFLSAAAELGASPEVTDAKRQLQAETELVTLRSAAAESKARESAAAASAAASAATANSSQPSAGGSAFIAARPLQALKVEYPPNADRGHIEGYAIVEFTLLPDGRATALSVAEANPANIFDRAALTAVGRGRFDTKLLVDGQPARARIKLTFKSS